MRVLVTGGSGFIGSHLVRSLVDRGDDVAIVDWAPSDARGTLGSVNVVACARHYGFDIRDKRDVSVAFRDFRPEAVCHLAAQVSVPQSFRDPHLDSSINVLGGINVLEAARAADCKRFVFASSGGAIYGHVPFGSASENDPPNVSSPYGASKLAFEQIMFSMARDEMECRSLRLSNVYGPDQKEGVVPSFLRSARAGQPLRVFGNCVRDYVHVSDVVAAFKFALSGLVPWPVMNVATGNGTDTLTLAVAIKSRAERDDISIEPARPGDVSRSVLLARRLHGLGIEPKTLEQGLRETAEERSDG